MCPTFYTYYRAIVDIFSTYRCVQGDSLLELNDGTCVKRAETACATDFLYSSDLPETVTCTDTGADGDQLMKLSARVVRNVFLSANVEEAIPGSHRVPCLVPLETKTLQYDTEQRYPILWFSSDAIGQEHWEYERQRFWNTDNAMLVGINQPILCNGTNYGPDNFDQVFTSPPINFNATNPPLTIPPTAKPEKGNGTVENVGSSKLDPSERGEDKHTAWITMNMPYIAIGAGGAAIFIIIVCISAALIIRRRKVIILHRPSEVARSPAASPAPNNPYLQSSAARAAPSTPYKHTLLVAPSAPRIPSPRVVVRQMSSCDITDDGQYTYTPIRFAPPPSCKDTDPLNPQELPSDSGSDSSEGGLSPMPPYTQVVPKSKRSPKKPPRKLTPVISPPEGYSQLNDPTVYLDPSPILGERYDRIGSPGPPNARVDDGLRYNVLARDGKSDENYQYSVLRHS